MSNFNIIAIDPGNNLGVAILTISTMEYNITNVNTFTVVLDQYVRGIGPSALERNTFLTRVCGELYKTYKPTMVVMEAAFMNPRFPLAVMQLSQYTSTISQTFYNMNPFTKIKSYPPKYIKKYAGGGGKANKLDMLTAVSSIPELSKHIILNRLTEHEIDAVAIGYVALVNLRLHPHELICF